jgi:hypothetical protein
MASEVVTIQVSPRLFGVCTLVPVPLGRAPKTPEGPGLGLLAG